MRMRGERMAEMDRHKCERERERVGSVGVGVVVGIGGDVGGKSKVGRRS